MLLQLNVKKFIPAMLGRVLSPQVYGTRPPGCEYTIHSTLRIFVAGTNFCTLKMLC